MEDLQLDKQKVHETQNRNIEKQFSTKNNNKLKLNFCLQIHIRLTNRTLAKLQRLRIEVNTRRLSSKISRDNQFRNQFPAFRLQMTSRTSIEENLGHVNAKVRTNRSEYVFRSTCCFYPRAKKGAHCLHSRELQNVVEKKPHLQITEYSTREFHSIDNQSYSTPVEREKSSLEPFARVLEHLSLEELRAHA